MITWEVGCSSCWWCFHQLISPSSAVFPASFWPAGVGQNKWPTWIIDIFSYEHTFKGIPVSAPPDQIFEEGKWQPARNYTAVLYFHPNSRRCQLVIDFTNTNEQDQALIYFNCNFFTGSAWVNKIGPLHPRQWRVSKEPLAIIPLVIIGSKRHKLVHILVTTAWTLSYTKTLSKQQLITNKYIKEKQK